MVKDANIVAKNTLLTQQVISSSSPTNVPRLRPHQPQTTQASPARYTSQRVETPLAAEN